MNYHRKWRSRRNAAGFAAECARLALPLYTWDRRSVVAAVAAIELAERYASGEEIDAGLVTRAAQRAARATNAAFDDPRVLRSITPAALAAHISVGEAGDVTNANDVTDVARAAAWDAARAGADGHELQAAFARWTVRDLSDGRELPAELRQAAGAAVVAGDEDLAKELLQ